MRVFIGRRCGHADAGARVVIVALFAVCVSVNAAATPSTGQLSIAADEQNIVLAVVQDVLIERQGSVEAVATKPGVSKQLDALRKCLRGTARP